MELEEYMEHDIIVYLDEIEDFGQTTPLKEETPTAYVTRDYESELKDAIARDDQSFARKVLFSLKDQFDQSPPNSEQKGQLKALLIKCYALFKSYIDVRAKDSPENFMKQVLTSAQPIKEKSREEKLKEEKRKEEERLKKLQEEARQRQLQEIQRLEEKLKEEEKLRQLQDEQRIKEQKIKEEDERLKRMKEEALKPPVIVTVVKTVPEHDIHALHALLSITREQLLQNKLHEAVESYRIAKQTALKMNLQLPVDLRQAFVLMYKDLKIAIEKHKGEISLQMISTPQPGIGGNDLDVQLLLQLTAEKQILTRLLASHDMQLARQHLQTMHLLVQQISNKQKQAAAQTKVQRIEEIVKELEQHSSHDDKVMVAMP